jgi:hypothetical protein
LVSKIGLLWLLLVVVVAAAAECFEKFDACAPLHYIQLQAYGRFEFG